VKSRAWRAILLVCRLILGGVFVYASVDKIVHPAAFADILNNYNLVPDWTIHLLAIWLPWIELTAGLFLIAGVFVRGSAMVLGGLLLVFIAALGVNLLRGFSIDCGCFTTTKGSHTGSMVGLIFRDLALLVPAVLILWDQWVHLRPQRD